MARCSLELTSSEIRTIRRVRVMERRRSLTVWVLGMSSVLLVSFAALEMILLAVHLHRHGVPFSNLLPLLSQTKLPGDIQVGIVFAAATLIPLTLIAGLHCAVALLVLLPIRHKEHQLLLRFDECSSAIGRPGEPLSGGRLRKGDITDIEQ